MPGEDTVVVVLRYKKIQVLSVQTHLTYEWIMCAVYARKPACKRGETMSKPGIDQNPLPLLAENAPLLEASLQGSWKVRIGLGVMHGSGHELQSRGLS